MKTYQELEQELAAYKERDKRQQDAIAANQRKASMADSGVSREISTSTSSDNEQAALLNQRRQGAQAKAQEIARRQLKQKQINQQKRNGGVG